MLKIQTSRGVRYAAGDGLFCAACRKRGRLSELCSRCSQWIATLREASQRTVPPPRAPTLSEAKAKRLARRGLPMPPPPGAAA